MRAVDPSRTFKVLMGTGAMVTFLLWVAVCRTVLAGCPEGWGGFACLFLPTHTDVGIHLLSYTFMGMIVSGISLWLVLWRRQWNKIHTLTRNLAPLYTSHNELESLAGRLGLKNKVHLLDSDVSLCFCAGFIMPQIYLSRRMMEKLPQEQLEALLLHEKYHLKNYDPLKILLGQLVVSALFFVPVLQDMFKRYLIEKEIAADESAIRYQGHNRGIASVLGSLLHEHYTASAPSLVAAGTEALDYRIGHLAGHAPWHPSPVPLSRLAMSLLAVAITLAAILAPLSGSHP